ncbi:MAG: sulfite exporter TauE/SafE family protein [Rhodospirillaceae bacterium]
MIADLLFYLIAVPAALAVGISKGGFGAGVVILAVPMLSLVIPTPVAATIMLPVLITTDFITVWVYRKDFSRPDMRVLLPGAFIGTALGWYGFQFLTQDGLKLMVGVIALIFTADYWLPLRPKKDGAKPAGIRGTFWGTLAGFTSFFAHAGGPPLQVYLLPRGLQKRAFVGTVGVFFWIVNLSKIPAYWNLNQFSQDLLLTSLVLMPLAPVGIGIGLWAQTRLNDKLFFKIVYGFLAFTGVKLTYDALRGMGYL